MTRLLEFKFYCFGRLGLPPDLRDLFCIENRITELYYDGWSIPDCIRYILLTGEYSPNIEEVPALEKMAALNSKYYDATKRALFQEIVMRAKQAYKDIQMSEKYVVILGAPKYEAFTRHDRLLRIGKQAIRFQEQYNSIGEAQTDLDARGNHKYWNYEVVPVSSLDENGRYRSEERDFQIVVGQPNWENWDTRAAYATPDKSNVGQPLALHQKTINLTQAEAEAMLRELNKNPNPFWHYEIVHMGVKLKLLPREKK